MVKELPPKPCRQVKPPGASKIIACQEALSAKNSSLNTLQELYAKQGVKLGNTSAELHECKNNQKKLDNQVQEEAKTLKELQGQLHNCTVEMKDQQRTHDSSVKGMRRVLSGMQTHLQCMETEENCRDVAGYYTCLTQDLAHHLCLTADVEGRELFDIPICLLLGDKTWANFSVKDFIAENPRIATLVIGLLVFSSIGVLTVLILLIWLTIRYRSQIRWVIGRCVLWVCPPAPKPTGDVQLKKVGENKPKETAEEPPAGGQEVPQAPAPAPQSPPVPPVDAKGLAQVWKRPVASGLVQEAVKKLEASNQPS